ncbi:MAG: hypothetical protein IJX71_04970 [Oscillospiraceae bacterium]|nr:hypothetical protein [Oscillospiraceae bacterium]
MKKRILSIILATAIAATAVGCSCNQPAQVTPSGTDPVETTEAPAPETTEAPETEVPTTEAPETTAAVKDVTISMEVYKEEEGIKITYPVLDGLKSESTQKEWNDLFFDMAAEAAQYLVAGDKYTSTWEVTSGTARVISLVNCAVLTDADGKTTRTLVAYNIDSSTGQAKTLSQLCDVAAIAADLAAADAAVAKKETNTAYSVVDAEGNDFTSKFTCEGLLDLNKKLITGPAASDVKAGLTRLLGYVDTDKLEAYSYWKDGVLHLVFPYTQAVTDYIDIEVKDAHRTSTSK